MRIQFDNGQKLAALLLTTMFGLAGCGGGDEEAPAAAASTSAPTSGGSTSLPATNDPPATSPGAPAGGNLAPVLSATPQPSIKVGTAYVLQPNASDPDGDTLAFSIANKPSWMSFNTVTGKLSGTPQAGNVGTYANIRIAVSDGEVSTSLAAFSIAVTQIATGAATLSWMPPVENTDGSSLTNLAGYRIHYGTSANTLDKTIAIDNASVNRYLVENLSPATWYFAIRSINAAGIESSLSGIASKTIG